jgi:uncharacterized membrane protein YdbT with pleckstrin-like domain
METAEQLKQIDLFKNLPTYHLTALAGIAQSQHFNPGERLVVQGDLGNRFFIVNNGLVNLRQTDTDGIEHSTGVIPTPASQKSNGPRRRYFGEQMFTSQEPFEYHADAVRPTDVQVITRDDFDKLVVDRPAILHALGFVRDAERKRTHGWEWITDGEAVGITARKHWWALLPSLLPVAIMALVASAILFATHFVIVQEYLQWFALAATVIVVTALIWQVYDWWNDEYIVTTHRVAHVERIFLTQELRESVPIEKVVGVTLDRKFPAAYFGVSTVIVETAGREEGNVTFAYVAHGEQIRRFIAGQQGRVRAREAAEERERFRQDIRQKLREYLAPEAVAHERAAQQQQESPSPPRRRKPVRQTLRHLVATWLNLEIVEPGRTTWRKHWIVLMRQTGRWLVGLVVLDLAALFFAVSPGMRFPGYWLVGLIGLIVCLGGLLWEWEDWRNDIYAVTDTQVVDLEAKPFGFGSKSTTAPLDQVQDIRVEVPSTLAFFLNYGDVRIETAGKGGQMIFFSIHHPRDAQEEIFRRLNLYRQNRAERENAMRSKTIVDALVAYDHFKQEQQLSPPNANAAAPDQNSGG